MAFALVAACANAETADAPLPAAEVDLTPPELKLDPSCAALDPDAAMRHLAAANRVRAALAVGGAPHTFAHALDELAAAQGACLAAAAAATPPSDVPARLLLRALLQDLPMERVDRAGVPPLAWRLVEDAAVRSAAALLPVTEALEAGKLSDANSALLAAQRVRLGAMPEIVRFLDEQERATLLVQPVWTGWLGVSP